MRGLVSFSVCVLFLVCMFTICNGSQVRRPRPSPWKTVDHNMKWANQSGSFAASVLNVKWYGNTKADAMSPQKLSGGRYYAYKIWFNAVRYSDLKKVSCTAQVQWPRPDKYTWTGDKPKTKVRVVKKAHNFFPRCKLNTWSDTPEAPEYDDYSETE